MVWYVIIGAILGAATVAGIVLYVLAKFFKGVEDDYDHPGDNTR